jgi:hypothetical protein
MKDLKRIGLDVIEVTSWNFSDKAEKNSGNFSHGKSRFSLHLKPSLPEYIALTFTNPLIVPGPRFAPATYHTRSRGAATFSFIIAE